MRWTASGSGRSGRPAGGAAPKVRDPPPRPPGWSPPPRKTAPPVPQFETAPLNGPAVFVRARSAEGAVADVAGRGAEAVRLGDAEAGSGWREASVDGAPWGRVRPRDRMRFRRD